MFPSYKGNSKTTLSSIFECLYYIGTVLGGGYNCKKNTVRTYHNVTTDGRIFITDGIWNNVSYHVPWIRQKAMELGEDLDNCGSGGGGGTGIKCTLMIFMIGWLL